MRNSKSNKTNEELLKEIDQLRSKVNEFEEIEIKHKHVEELAEAIYQNAPFIMLLVDQDRRVRKANGAAVEFSGSKEEDLLGLRGAEALRCLHHLDDPKGCGFGPFCKQCKVRSSILDTFKTGDNYSNVEAMLPFLIDGEEKELTLLVSTVILKEFTEPLTLVTLEEITERKKAEEELIRNESMLKETERLAMVGSWNWEVEKDIVYWSDELYRLTQQNPELPPPTYAVHSTLYTPESWELLSSAVEKAVRDGVSYNLELNMVLPDKEIRTVLTLGIAIKDDSGRVIRLFGMVQDITERKQAEKELLDSEMRFKAIYENAPVLIDAFDENGRCVLWNNQCRKTFGWTIDEVNMQDDALTLFYPDPAVREEVMRSVTAEPAGQFREWCPVTKSGKTLTTMWANFSLPEGLTFNLGYDITERKKAEEELIKHRQNLEEIVLERTKNLEEQNKKLDDAMKVFVGREKKIGELERRLRALGGKV